MSIISDLTDTITAFDPPEFDPELDCSGDYWCNCPAHTRAAADAWAAAISPLVPVDLGETP
jgi:hypothetical protein